MMPALVLLLQIDDLPKALAEGREKNRPVCLTIGDAKPPEGFVWARQPKESIALPDGAVLILEPAIEFKEPKDPPPDNPSPLLKKAMDNPLTFEFPDTPLSEFFFFLGEYSVKFKPDAAVDQTLKVSLKGKNTPVSKILKNALVPLNLSFHLDGDWVVVDVSKEQKRAAALRPLIIAARGKDDPDFFKRHREQAQPDDAALLEKLSDDSPQERATAQKELSKRMPRARGSIRQEYLSSQDPEVKARLLELLNLRSD